MTQEIPLVGTQVVSPVEPTTYELLVVQPTNTFSVDNEVTLCVDTSVAPAILNLPPISRFDGNEFTIYVNPTFGSPNVITIVCDAKDEILSNGTMSTSFVIDSQFQTKFTKFVAGSEWMAS